MKRTLGLIIVLCGMSVLLAGCELRDWNMSMREDLWQIDILEGDAFKIYHNVLSLPKQMMAGELDFSGRWRRCDELPEAVDWNTQFYYKGSSVGQWTFTTPIDDDGRFRIRNIPLTGISGMDQVTTTITPRNGRLHCPDSVLRLRMLAQFEDIREQ